MKVKATQTVAFKLIGILALEMVLFGVILLGVISRRVNSGVVDYIEGTLPDQVYGVTHLVEEATAGASKLVRQMTETYVNSGFTNEDVICQQPITNLGAEQTALFDVNGNKISTLPFDLSSTALFVNNALSGEKNNYLIKEGDSLFTIAFMPIKKGDEIVGASLVKKRVTSQSFVDKIKTLYGLEATYFDGYIRAYTTFSGIQGSSIDDKTIIDRAMNDEMVIEETIINLTKVLSCYFPVKDYTGKNVAVLFIGKNIEDVQSVSDSISTPLMIIVSVMTVFMAICIFILIYLSVVRKVKLVQKSVENLASGDADLTMRIPITSKDEFGNLCENVNIFIEMLQSLIKKLSGAQETLGAIGNQLGEHSQETASATTEIMANIDSVRNQSQTQSKAVNDTSKSLYTSLGDTQTLVNLIDEQVAGIVESSAAIEEMIENIKSVSSSVEKMSNSFRVLGANVEDGNTKLVNVEARVKQMADESQMLVEANNMIAQVASQTNLLAMNAAIEAAHAGDAGKGFSVVADEIRKLAETTTIQSKRIKEELRVLSESIQSVVSLTNTSRTSFGSIVSQLDTTDTILSQIDNAMTEQNLASKQVLEALSSIKDQTTSVNDKSKDLNEVIKDVQSNMDVVSQVSQTILGSMDEMAAGSQQISSSAQSVSELSRETEENISAVAELLGQFKV